MLVCGIKKDQFLLRDAGRFNVHFNWFCCKVPSNFWIIFSLGSISSRDKISAAVFIFSGTCAMLKLNCITKSQTFHKGGGFIFVWKNLVTDTLSVMMMTGLVALRNKSSSSLKAS